MFSKIPQRLANSFALLGDEAKLAFRSQPTGISKLATARNIPETDSYWNQYFVLFDSASDVFTLITPHDVRRALLDAPENVATLIRVIILRLFNLVSDHTFPTQSNASVTAFASSFIKAGTGSLERNTTKEVLNCLRILQRVLPAIFEVEGETDAFEREVLWKKHEFTDTDDTPAATEITPQFVIEDDDDGSENGEDGTATPVRARSPRQKSKKVIPSLGERLISCLVDLLFCCGFTLPVKFQVDHRKINYVIWEKGIGSTSDPGSNHQYDCNKTEVLRLLLVLLSRQIYVPASLLLSKPSLYTLHIVQKMPRRDVLTVLCSLLNTIMTSRQSSGTGFGSVTGKLPYNHLVFKGEDPRSSLVSICLQVLCALLDFQSGSARDNLTNVGETQCYTPTLRTNAFRYFLAKLHRTQDFAFLVEGIMGILELQLAAMNNLLPGARKSIPYVTDTILFFWKTIELNKKFRSYVLDSDKAMDLIAYLLCYGLEIKDKPQQHGLCRALSYILQTLSAEQAFGLKLSNPIKVTIPSKWNAGGTAADFLVHAVYAMVATTSGTLTSIYPSLIITLSNSAPYFKHLPVTASTRLIQLFNSFMNPSFLLADEGHPRLLYFMLEVFNSVIFHNLTENQNLLYGILTAHKSFEDLGTFTLVRGLKEIKRVKMAKEEHMRKTDGISKGKNSINSLDGATEDESAHHEKARLLESEGAVALERSERDSLDSVNVNEHLIQPSHTPPGEQDMTAPRASSAAEGLSITHVGVSEKSRGKMKERGSISLDNTSSLDLVATTGVGRNGFVPTQEWVTSWQQGLPLDNIMLVISELLPKIQDLQASRHRTNTTTAIIDFLGSVTLDHVLPPAPALTPRTFQWSDASIIWSTSLIWGEIYVRGMTPLGIWNSTNVRLFHVKHTQVQQRQITEAVTSVVGGFLGRSSDPSTGSGRRTGRN